MSKVEKNRGIRDAAITATTRGSDINDGLSNAQLQTELERKGQELHELEALVKQLFKNIPLPMHLMYVDKDYRIRYVSEELAKYRGFKSTEEVTGLKTTELFPKKGGEAINAVIDTGKPIDHAEMVLGIVVDGKKVEVPILASCRPIYDKRGGIVGAVPAFTEITELKEKEKAIKEQQEYLQRNTEKISKAISEIARGNLDVQLEKEKSDEIGEIIDNLNLATVSLSELLAELHDSMKNVSSVGDESYKFAGESAENANEMNELAKKSSEGMNRIREAISDAVEIIKNLGSSIDQVGKTTDTIEDIANQTNMLALNATIEAAHAGKHGRSFAVVAEEVRKLAEKAKKSTAEIDSMMKRLQEEMEKVMKAVNTSSERAEIGREDLEKAIRSVEKTTSMIEDIKNRIQEISDSARKGVESIEKVSLINTSKR